MAERSGQAGAYEPGVCNIGAAEIRLRWALGHVATLVTLGFLVLVILLDAPRGARLLVALPATGAAFSYLEAHFRFCGSFGLLGIYNFRRVGTRERVVDQAARARDRARALRLTLQAGAIGLTAGVLAALLPV